jgi:adenosylcobyric acid synthase
MATIPLPWPEYAQYKEQQYDQLADHIREHVDMQYLYRSLKGL